MACPNTSIYLKVLTMSDQPGMNDLQQRFARLAGYLELDPDNLNLLGDAAAGALEAGLPDRAVELVDRYQAIAPLPAALLNLKGLAALSQEQFDVAAGIFADLRVTAPDDTGLRFNLAWAKTMLGDDAGAAELLDDATARTVPGAAVLKVQAFHRLGDLESALQYGVPLAEARPDDAALLGALSLVAMDAQQPELARGWAARSQTTADGLSSLGVLTLQDYRTDEALACFDRGLALRPDSARNLLGKGLALMSSGDGIGAAKYLDQAAGIFGSHLGTWIAAGWAHFVNGDRVRAREIFESCLELDDTFAETHGALAVLDIMDGQLDSARRRTETALRLDRKCFAGALARSMLLEHDGDAQSAQRVRDIALNAPLESGQTLAQAMVHIAPNWRSRPKP